MKIKFNWGFGIVVAMVLFIGFIMFFIVRMTTDTKFDHDLVTDDYYKKELAFQDEIDAEKNSKALAKNIVVEQTKAGIKIDFPSDKKNIEGTVHVYRPSSEKLDVVLPISLSNSSMLVPAERLVEGVYKLSIDWKSGGVDYLYKMDLRI